jgi:hypothetical protein
MSRANPTPEEIARFNRETERLDRELARKISEWARTWERCPLAGCRRNNRCLDFDNCRGVSHEPLSEEDLQKLREALAPYRDRPLYGGTGR